ncbi:hypothetical protein ACFPJ1_03865 [Kribbella qitaiheensis]|uniref:hypothetical protein n=1 Tax=Kribbella qitaiheensis TaxID=1544730 RepID=UPI00360A91EC
MTAVTPVSETLTIYVPCDVASVRARLGYQDTLTPIEQIVLRAVHAGAATLPDLCVELGFTRRMAVDLVHDLWQANYLRLVRSYAGLQVSPTVGEKITRGRLAELPSAETVVENRAVMIEKLSGYLLPVRRRELMAPRDRSLAVPIENSPILIQDAEVTDIIEALERDLRSEDREESGRQYRRVLGAYVQETGGGAGAGRRWLPLDVRATVDPDTDQLMISVVDDALPAAHRDLSSRTLTTLVTNRPDDEFTRALRGRARPILLDQPTLPSIVARLTQLAGRAGETMAGRRMKAHGELESLLGYTRSMIGEYLAQEVTADLVVGADHNAVLDELIDEARTQIVMAGPWMREGGLTAIEDGLAKAMTERRTQVCLLWGIGYGEKKDPRAANALYQLALKTKARSYGALDTEDLSEPTGAGAVSTSSVAVEGTPTGPWFLVPPDSSRIHAKLAVADARTALVTSWNFMSKADARNEIGVAVRAPGQAASGRPVHDLLRWSSSRLGYQMSRQLLAQESAFALPAKSETADPEPDDLRLQTPGPPPGEGTDENTLGAVRQWASNWSSTAAAISGWLAGRTLPTATLVIDGGHRQALWSALRRARVRLVIASHRLSGEVVNDQLIRALELALERNVDVRIHYGEPHSGEDIDPEDPAGTATTAEWMLFQLAERFPGRLIVRRSGTHAKVLLWDDVAVIGSFNFLSHEGTYSTRNAFRQRSEISLQLSGAAFADDVARWAGLAITDRPDQENLPASVSDPLAAEAQQLLNAVAEDADPADSVEHHLAASGHPWLLLDRLSNASTSVLRIAAALCLSQWPDDGAPGRRLHWHRWLVTDLWTSGAYLEAAVLRAALTEDTARPRTAIAILAAARNTPQYSTAFLEAYVELPPTPGEGVPLRLDLTDVESGERSAILAAAVELVLFRADPMAIEVLAEYQTLLSRPQETTDMMRLVPAWRRLVSAAITFAEEGSGRPLPQDQIRVLIAQGDAPLAVTRLWERLRIAIRRATETQLANTHSQRTLHELMRTDEGGIGALGEIAEQESRSLLRTWVAQAPTAESGFGKWIDQAGQRVDPSRPAIHSTHRRKVIRDLSQIVREARRLDRLPDAVEATSGPEEIALLTAARHCAAVVAEVLPVMMLDADSPEAGVPERRLVQDIMRDLLLLESWHLAENSGTSGDSADEHTGASGGSR